MTDQSRPGAPDAEPALDSRSSHSAHRSSHSTHTLSHSEHAANELPLGIRVAAAWCWRLIVIALAIAGVVWLIMVLHNVVIPLVVAILLTALLHPIVAFFERRGWPRALGVATAMLTLFASIALLVSLIVTQLRGGLDDVAARSQAAWQQFLHWIEQPPLNLNSDQIDHYVQQITAAISSHQSEILTGALKFTTTAGHLLTGILLVLFSLIFLLLDGKRVWYWVLGFLPKRAHAAVDSAGRAGWVSVGQFVRVQIFFVAIINAVGIGVGAVLLGVPLPFAIGVLVFFGSFLPFIGAISTGAVAVFISLIYNGPVNAVIMLLIVILVHQIESHVLQPLIIGHAVSVHPLAVVLAVATGLMVGGIAGALFAVPVAAALSSMVDTITERKWDPNQDPVSDYLKRQKTHRIAKHRARQVARLNRKG